jgi:hypothetical protein
MIDLGEIRHDSFEKKVETSIVAQTVSRKWFVD